jgi:T1SS-143 domain-containing protein
MAQNNTPTTNNTPTQTDATTVTAQGVNNGPAAVKGVDMGMIVDTSGPNINPAALDASAAIQARAASAQASPVNFTAMAFGKSETLNKPAAGQVATFQASAGEQFKVNFDPNAAQLSVRNGDLVFTFNDGAQIVVDNFVQSSAQMPSLALPDGTILAGGVVVAQLTGQSADDLFDIETAAGPNGAGGSGNFIYNDNLGGVIDLLNKLPPIPFLEMANLAVEDREPLPLLNPDYAPPEQLPVNNLVDETGGFGIPGKGNNHVTGTIPADYGRDGAGSIGLKPDFSYSGSVAGGVLTSHGKPVITEQVGNTIVGKTEDGVVVFEMTVNPDGTYDFKLLDQLDHANKSDPDDRLDLHFTYVVSDRDGDEGLGSITIGVKDDGPVAVNDENHVNIVVHEFNIIGNAPDFPALQEQTNLPQNRPDLFEMGTAKASNVIIDKPTTVTVERIQTSTQVAGANSPLFGFTQDKDGNITNVQLLFGNGTSNDSNNGPTHAEYNMTSGGKLGFFIVTSMTGKLVEIGAVDANGKINPDFSFKVVPTADGKYGVEYTYKGESKLLEGPARFGGDFLGQDVQGVAGRQDGDKDNQLRYGFEDMPYEHADMDFNDVQFKVTVNPTSVDSALPVSGNVLVNDDVGQDVMHDKEHDSVVTKVGLKDGTQISFDTPTGTDAKGKFITIQGEYGVLKMYENGDYTYAYNTGKKDGDLRDDFNYTMRDYDGDTSSADLKITLGVSHNYAPSITPAGGEVREDALIPNGETSITKDIIINSPDGVDKIELTDKGLPDLYVDGKKVEYDVSPDGKTLTGTVDGEKVLEVTLKDPVKQPDGSYKAEYEFTLEKPLDNPGPGENTTNIPVQVIVTDPQGDKATSTIPLKVVDDVPVAVDDSKAMGTSSVATGNIIANDSFGADGSAPSASKVNSITYNGVTKTFDTPDSVVSFTTPKGVLEIKGDGSYTFTRNATLGDLNETFTYTIKDKDGDVSNAKLTITGNDNPVTIITPDPNDPSAGGNGALIREDALLVPGTDSVTKDIIFKAPDGVESIKLTTDGLPSLQSGGNPVVYTLSPDGKTVTGTAGGQPVFTVVLGNPVQQPDGSYKTPYTFTLLKPLDNPGTGENITDIPVKFVATDTDGDKATGTLPLKVVDDVPVAVDDSKAMGTSSVATGNIIANDNFGADGSAPSASKVNSITYNGVTKTFDTPDSVVSFTTPKGVLEIKGDGSYTFTRNATLGDLNETFTYTIKDKDGDVSNAKLTITGNDNPVTIITPDPNDPSAGGNGALIREDALLVPGTDSVTKDIIFKAPDGVESIKLTTDGLPSLQSGGNPVVYTLSPDGKTVTGTAGGQPVFTVVLGNPVQQPDGSYKTPYTFTLLKPLDNPGTGENITDIPVKFVATDTDGDKATGTLPLKVVDDVPVANDDVNSVADRGSVDGNILTGVGQNGGADVMSADLTKLTSVSFGGTTKSFTNPADVQTDANGKFVTINGQYGSLKLYENGNYTYKHENGSGKLVDQFNYRITDRDGDSDTAKLTINIENGVPSIPDIQGGKQVDETHDINVALTGTIAYTNGNSVAFGQANGSAGFAAEGSLMNNALTSNGQPVNVALINGQYVGYTGSDPNAAGAKVFELSLNGSNYSFKLLSNLDHADGNNPNDVISLKFAVTASDADGDKATGMLKIDVLDDAPIANPDTNQAVTIIREFNVIGNAPDFPTLQEQHNLPKDRPDLYKMGVDKASNVHIDLPTTVTIERYKSDSQVSVVQSPLFAFTQDANGNITNVQLLFGVASANPNDPGALNATYQMTTGGKLGFFIAGGGTEAMKTIGAIDDNGNPQPGFSFSLKFNPDSGKYDIQYTHNGETKTIYWQGDVSSPLVARFAGDFYGQDIQGVAGRQDGDGDNQLRYGFEDLSKNMSDEDYNDVQIKVTINPIITEVTDPIHGNVLPNDKVGQDDIPGIPYGTHLTQVSLGNGAFISFANASGTDAGGKFINIQGDYGLLKIYENGEYTYTYNTAKKDGDMADDFRYTIRDYDGDTSTTSLTITINLDDQTHTSNILSAATADEPFASTAFSLSSAEAGMMAGHEQHDVVDRVEGSDVVLGHQGSDNVLNEVLTSHGEVINTIVIDQVVHGFVGSDYEQRDADVFSLSLNQNGSYAFDLYGQIDQAASGTVISFDYTAKESDGSVIESQIAIGVDGDTAVAVASAPASNALSLDDVLGSQDSGGHDSADGMNHVASIDIINNILSDDDPHNGYAG